MTSCAAAGRGSCVLRRAFGGTPRSRRGAAKARKRGSSREPRDRAAVFRRPHRKGSGGRDECFSDNGPARLEIRARLVAGRTREGRQERGTGGGSGIDAPWTSTKPPAGESSVISGQPLLRSQFRFRAWRAARSAVDRHRSTTAPRLAGAPAGDFYLAVNGAFLLRVDMLGAVRRKDAGSWPVWLLIPLAAYLVAISRGHGGCCRSFLTGGGPESRKVAAADK